MSKNLNTQWRVERRLSRKHKWVKAGLFETRERAREEAEYLRYHGDDLANIMGYGFGNTRIVKYVRGAK